MPSILWYVPLARASIRTHEFDAFSRRLASQGIDLLAHGASSGGAVLVDVTTLRVAKKGL